VELAEEFAWQGRTIACGRAGTGPAVVFCHGTPFSSTVWSRYADALSDSCTVHVWDMPGYGRSSKRPDDPVHFGAQAAAFAALIEHWELDRPHVVAHDFGGAVSIRAALIEQVAYASLLLVDVVAIPPTGSPFFRFVRDHPDTLEHLPPYIHEAIVRTYIRNASHRGLTAPDLDQLVAPWLTDDGRSAFYRQIAQYDEQYLVENERRIGELDLPVRVVWGADDGWIPIQTGRRAPSVRSTPTWIANARPRTASAAPARRTPPRARPPPDSDRGHRAGRPHGRSPTNRARAADRSRCIPGTRPGRGRSPRDRPTSTSCARCILSHRLGKIKCYDRLSPRRCPPRSPPGARNQDHETSV
jgi:pimeloyl-ACP methyl ester carboxylesterase